MFYLVTMQNGETQIVYAYQSLDEAVAAFHSELAYRGEGRNKTVCVILNSIGELVKREYWVRPEQPEPEPNQAEE